MSPAEQILSKALLPTHLNSREAREQIVVDSRRRSLWTARCIERDFLKEMQTAVADVAGGHINNADFRERLRGVLDTLGYDPERGGWVDDPFNDGEPVAGLQNLRSIRRLNLIADTQRTKAASVARLNLQTPSVLADFPAWRLTRYETRAAERDWGARWWNAAVSVDWEGVAPGGREMVALKGSPIWQALGDGAGGYTDALGDAMPPFAFNSGMDFDDVDREESEALGLNPYDAVSEEASLWPNDDEIANARKKFDDGFVDELLTELEDLE
jgi:hypothetical protein